MAKKECEFCNFWNLIKDDTGSCHRYPPTVHVHLLPAGPVGGIVGSNRQGVVMKPVETVTWPRTKNNESCGEWNGE